MPPKSATANAPRRKGPQFNPPRPVTASSKPIATAKRPAAGAARPAGARTSAHQSTTVISSDEEPEEDEEHEDDDDLMEDALEPAHNARTASTTLTTQEPIPVALLSRLLHENFSTPDTQIQKGAMSLVGKYMEIFVREALLRAKNEREHSVKAGGIADGFLQVEDLEKLAPQLVLDF